jgi:hypothetical protein
MRLPVFFCFFLFTYILNPSPIIHAETQQSKIFLEILNVDDEEMLAWRPLISGRVSTPFTEVWLIIHALETSAYWVQPKATIRSVGSWESTIFLGDSGMLDVGKKFELMAVANPRNLLKEGLQLAGWPRAEGKSKVMSVNRR